MKRIKHFFNDMPWKSIKTRKLAFIYVLICGTLVILFGAILLALGKDLDSGVWLTQTFSFLKWMLTTGVVIVISANTKDIVHYMKSIQSDEDEGAE